MATVLEPTQNISENYQRYSKYFSQEDKSAISMDTFYQLLIAEMSKQDPLEPMSNTEFISQMASFSALKAQTDALYYNNANYAQSLVGKNATVAYFNGDEMITETGIVTSMRLVDDTFKVMVNGEEYELKNIVEVLPGTNPYQVTGADGAYGASLIGKNVTISMLAADGGTLVEQGIVSHVEIKDNELSVIINNMAYPVSSIVKISPVGDSTTNTPTVGSINPNTAAYAASLIGKNVNLSWSTDNVIYNEQGIVEYFEINNGNITVKVNNKSFPIEYVNRVSDQHISE